MFYDYYSPAMTGEKSIEDWLHYLPSEQVYFITVSAFTGWGFVNVLEFTSVKNAKEMLLDKIHNIFLQLRIDLFTRGH